MKVVKLERNIKLNQHKIKKIDCSVKQILQILYENQITSSTCEGCTIKISINVPIKIKTFKVDLPNIDEKMSSRTTLLIVYVINKVV